MCDKRKQCINCGSKNHISNTCPCPITSYGIININLTDELKMYKDELKSIFNNFDEHINMDEFNEDEEKTNLYDEIYQNVYKSLLFLLVSRKHSLGYIEFIRGRYNIKEKESIQHLFLQMTEYEITSIKQENFDILWCRLWKKNAKKQVYDKEYQMSNEKFTFVKENINLQIFKPTFPTSEWGFPKGRRNTGENDIDCAIRECCEETNLLRSEMNILQSINPIVEQMVGTNGVEYRHIYYISIIDNIRRLNTDTDLNSHHYIEIDTIGWFKRDRVRTLIRPYHVEKLNIVDKIINFLTFAIYCKKNKS